MRVVLLLAALLCAGCYSTGSVGTHWRTAHSARAEWGRRASKYRGVPFVADFATGFQAGYVDTATGGSGNQPALAPPKYRHIQLNKPNGRARSLAWFNGFSAGAAACQEVEDGTYMLSPDTVDALLAARQPPDSMVQDWSMFPIDVLEDSTSNPMWPESQYSHFEDGSAIQSKPLSLPELPDPVALPPALPTFKPAMDDDPFELLNEAGSEFILPKAPGPSQPSPVVNPTPDKVGERSLGNLFGHSIP